MKYSEANKFVTIGRDSGVLSGPYSSDQVKGFAEKNHNMFVNNYEIYELVPAKLIPAQAAKLVRA